MRAAAHAQQLHETSEEFRAYRCHAVSLQNFGDRLLRYRVERISLSPDAASLGDRSRTAAGGLCSCSFLIFDHAVLQQERDQLVIVAKPSQDRDA